MVSQAEHVREFTAGAGQPTPDMPELMSHEEVHFITKMIIDETLELWARRFRCMRSILTEIYLCQARSCQLRN